MRLSGTTEKGFLQVSMGVLTESLLAQHKHQVKILPVNNIKKGGVLFSSPENVFSEEGLGTAS